MHTFKGKENTFLFNGDFSGDIIVRKDGEEFTFSGQDMIDLCQKYFYNIINEDIWREYGLENYLIPGNLPSDILENKKFMKTFEKFLDVKKNK